jgi:hypothetical protein
MKHSKEYALLFLVIIGIGLYLLLRPSDGVQYELPELAALNTRDVDTVRISSGNSSLFLRRGNETWRIAGKGYEADGDRVQELLNRVADPGISALVSQSGDYTRYHLDPKRRIRVEAQGDGETLRELILGKSASEVANTYIKLPGDENIYMAESDLRGTFEVTAGNLRDKTVFRVDRDAVRSVRLSSVNGSRRIRRAEAEESGTNATDGPAWTDKQGDKVGPEKVQKLMNSLETVTCREYTESLSRNGTGYSIAVTTDSTHRLRLFEPKGDSATAYAGESSQARDPFVLPGYKGRAVVSAVKGLLGEPTRRSDTGQ